MGVVCDGAISNNRSDLRAYVYALDLATSTWSTIFDFPLTYPKGPSDFGDGVDGRKAKASANWRTWTDTFSEVLAGDVVRSQPILSGITFDIDNSLVLGLMDRTGLQGGANNYSTDVNDFQTYYTVSGGDILRAEAFSNNVYVLENNATVAGITGAFPNNNQGPGLGEFYNDDFTLNSILLHAENALGGVVIRPGSGEVVATTIDPLNGVTNSGGFRQLSNANGSVQSAYVLYFSPGVTNALGKSVGLGNPTLGCATPTFLEIGNRVWVDTNQDGIQDPCETPLAGVQVSLYQSGTLVATTTTDANGEYYFNNNPVSSTVAGTVSTTSLLPNTAYQVTFGGGGQFTGTTPNGGQRRLWTNHGPEHGPHGQHPE